MFKLSTLGLIGITLLLTSIYPIQERVTYYDLIELNTFTLETNGLAVSTEQYIAWDWDTQAGCYRCQWWEIKKHRCLEKVPEGYQLRIGVKIIRAKLKKVTYTNYDPEILDRQVWPVEKRRRPR